MIINKSGRQTGLWYLFGFSTRFSKQFQNAQKSSHVLTHRIPRLIIAYKVRSAGSSYVQSRKYSVPRPGQGRSGFFPDQETSYHSLHPSTPVRSKLWHFMLWRSAGAIGGVKTEGPHYEVGVCLYIFRLNAIGVLEAFGCGSELPSRCPLFLMPWFASPVSSDRQ